MEIINKRVEDLIPYENNPRKNDDAVEYVANSIREFGFKVPIVIDKENVIVAGHTRLKAAEELGLEEVPCIVADDLTEEQVKAFRLADNKVGEPLGFLIITLMSRILKTSLQMLKKKRKSLKRFSARTVASGLRYEDLSCRWDIWKP